MKNRELLDMIGEVNEDYVLEAGNNITRPRSNWKTLAACAACAALVLAAYPVYRTINPPPQPLHEYTVVERGGAPDMQGTIKAPAGDTEVPVPAPAPAPSGGYTGGDADSDDENIYHDVPGQDAPVQEAAQAQSDGLRKGLGGQGGYGPETYPDWFGGAWIDNGYYPEAKLRVAIVDGFRTAELEAQIQEWCSGGVVFQDVKYSREYLFALQGRVVDTITDRGLQCGIGVDMDANCVGVDIFGETIPDAVLAGLARLDPDGDAIRVRVFTGAPSIAGELVKGPAPEEPAVDPDDPPDACPTPIDGSEPAMEDFNPDHGVTVEDGSPENHDVIPEGE